MFFGPKTAREMDGPEEMYVILVDNGRTRLLKEEIQRSVFNCIHCGACTALCPVFKHVNSSNELYGPLNCVVNPIRDGFDEAGYMAFACTLCGKCTEVCPAKIDFQEMILYNRKESVERDCFASGVSEAGYADVLRRGYILRPYLSERGGCDDGGTRVYARAFRSQP